MCFSSRAHTFLHRATLASHLMASRISPSPGEVLSAGSEQPQPAPQVRLLGKEALANSFTAMAWEVAAELYHLNAH